MKKYVCLPVLILVVVSACIQEKTVDSTRINLLEKADIEVDGWPSDWKDIAPIYKDSEKSMFAVIDDKYLVVRVDYVNLKPLEETCFLGIDTDCDEIMDYKIELSEKNQTVFSEKDDSGEWEEINADIEGFVFHTVEIAVPLATLDAEGFFLTGWVYDNSIENVTSHFPWIRSLHPETAFDPAQLTRNEWKEDFEALYYLVKYNYPYLWVKERTHGYNWLDLKDDYMERLDKIETNEEFLDLITEAVATLHNGHTCLLNYKNIEHYKKIYLQHRHVFDDDILEANKHWEKLRDYSCPEVLFSYIGGEYTAIDGLGDWKEKYGIEKGAKVVEINGKDVNEAVQSVVKRTRVWHDCDRDKLFMWHLNPEIFGEDTIFTIKNPDGTVVKKSIECVSKDPYEEYFRSDKSNLEFRKWKDKKVAYIGIKTFIESDNTFKDRSRLLEFYKSIQDYSILILDIRGNGGGNNSYWTQNIVSILTDKDLEIEFLTAYRHGKYINGLFKAALPVESISHVPPEVRTNEFLGFRKHSRIFRMSTESPFHGNIYLLVDRGVYSAAESFAAFVKASGFATLVGTTTGGDGIGDSPFLFVLPNSKLVIRMSSSMGINPDGTANEETHTSPDIYFERTEWENDEEIIEFLLEEIVGNN